MLAGGGGGSGTTTYAENIGVMAATRVYSTAAYIIAAAVALILSMLPKFGALIATIPPGAPRAGLYRRRRRVCPHRRRSAEPNPQRTRTRTRRNR